MLSPSSVLASAANETDFLKAGFLGVVEDALVASCALVECLSGTVDFLAFLVGLLSIS